MCQIVQGTGSVSILVPVIVIKVGQEVIALNTRVNGSIIVQVKSVFTSLNGIYLFKIIIHNYNYYYYYYHNCYNYYNDNYHNYHYYY